MDAKKVWEIVSDNIWHIQSHRTCERRIFAAVAPLRQVLSNFLQLSQAGFAPFLGLRTTHQFIQESYVPHPDIAHPFGNPPGPNYERIPDLQPVGKGLGVCSKGVLKWMDPIWSN